MDDEFATNVLMGNGHVLLLLFYGKAPEGISVGRQRSIPGLTLELALMLS